MENIIDNDKCYTLIGRKHWEACARSTWGKAGLHPHPKLVLSAPWTATEATLQGLDMTVPTWSTSGGKIRTNYSQTHEMLACALELGRFVNRTIGVHGQPARYRGGERKTWLPAALLVIRLEAISLPCGGCFSFWIFHNQICSSDGGDYAIGWW